MMAQTTDGVNEVTPVISNILCYMSTARHSMRSDDIIRACLVFYKDEDIIKGKDLLYEFGGERSIRRRNENRIMHELQDILELFKKCDENDIKIPKFVADTYNGMPPSAGFDVVAQAIQILIQETSDLKKEIESLKDNRNVQEVINHDSRVMQEDLMIIKGEMRKLNHKFIGEEIRRDSMVLNTLSSTFDHVNKTPGKTNKSDLSFGAFGPSVPHSDNAPVLIDDYQNDPSAPPASQEDFHILNRLLNDEGGMPTAPSYAKMLNNSRFNTTFNATNRDDIPRPLTHTKGELMDERNGTKSLTGARVKERLQTEVIHEHAIDKDGKTDDDGYTLVMPRKRRKNIVGSRQTDTLKSAVRMGDLYIGNCETSVTVQLLTTYIRDEISVNIQGCEQLNSRSAHSNSFKVTLNMDDRRKLLCPDVWPEGIVCRKFFNPRKNIIPDNA